MTERKVGRKTKNKQTNHRIIATGRRVSFFLIRGNLLQLKVGDNIPLVKLIPLQVYINQNDAVI